MQTLQERLDILQKCLNDAEATNRELLKEIEWRDRGLDTLEKQIENMKDIIAQKERIIEYNRL